MVPNLPPSTEHEDSGSSSRPSGTQAECVDSKRPRFNRLTRLRNRQQFDVVFQSGIKMVNRELVARIRPLPVGKLSRLGLSVSRKVGGAPRRNRVKRCLRAAFRELSPGLEQPLELVLIARPMSAPDDYATSLKSLADILRRFHKRHGPVEGKRPRDHRGSHDSGHGK
ncbi:MAG: ribonuclease P protein component [Planctomycetota bacterium]|nr:ribonuclease P protein component [Planctomycetota bacterium]